MHHQALENIGLSEKEAEVYETLLRIGPSAIPAILDAVPYKRGDLYNILTSLEEWDLLDIKEETGKKLYIAKHPNKLEDLVNEQAKEIQRQKNTLGEVLGDLKSMYNLSYNKPGVRFFEGKKGMEEAYNKILDIRETIYSIEDKGDMVEFFGKYVSTYVSTRIKRKIWNKSICPDTNTINDPDPTRYIDSRQLPVKDFPFSMDIKIAGNTVQFATLKEDQAVAFHVTHPIIAENFKVMFNYMWEQASNQPKYKKKINTESNNKNLEDAEDQAANLSTTVFN